MTPLFLPVIGSSSVSFAVRACNGVAKVKTTPILTEIAGRNRKSLLRQILSHHVSSSRCHFSSSSSSSSSSESATFSPRISSSSSTTPAEDFGYNPGGSCISNKDTILSDIDRALGVKKPPDIEVFLTEHVCNVANKASRFIHLNLIRFGHVGIRYRTSDGIDRVMNINGDFTPRRRQRSQILDHHSKSADGHDHDENSVDMATMVNFVPPREFIFGTDRELAQQGGVYNRPFVSVRIENASRGATDALHAYYEALHKASVVETNAKRQTDYDGGNDGRMVHTDKNKGNQGAVRFNLVDVNLSYLARLLPPPFDQLPLRITSFFQQRHERLQQSRETTARTSIGNEVDRRKRHVDEMDPAIASIESSGDGFVESTSSKSRSAISDTFENATKIGNDAVKGVEEVYHDVREATFVAGNCAQWTSNGLAFCGLLRRPRIFPKAILIDLLEDEVFSGRTNNVNVVVYEQVGHAKRKTDWGGPYKYIKSAYVHPLRPIRNFWYSNPEDFASAVVSVPCGSTTAIVKTQTPAKRPKRVFTAISLASAVIPAAIMTGLVDSVGPIGPLSAAIWIGLNYWLY